MPFKRCAYCGATDNITKDHVPPKCLFDSGRKINLITVPACGNCNSSFKKDDEYFRLMLALHPDLADKGEFQYLMDAAKRALNKPQSRSFKKHLNSNISIKEMFSAEGIYLGSANALKVDVQRMIKIARRILVGLYFHHHKEVIPSEYEIAIFLKDTQKNDSAFQSESVQDILKYLEINGTRIVSNNVLNVWIGIPEDDRRSSVWYVSIAKTFGYFAFITSEQCTIRN